MITLDHVRNRILMGRGRHQRWIDPVTGMLIAGAIGAGGQIGGALLTPKSSTKRVSTLSKNQKQMDRLLFDFLMGITRDAKGKQISANPWLQRLAERPPIQKQAPFTPAQRQIQSLAAGIGQRMENRPGPNRARLRGLEAGILPQDQNLSAQTGTFYAAAGGVFGPGTDIMVGEDGPEKLKILGNGMIEVIPNPKTLKSKKSLARGVSKSKALVRAHGADLGLVQGLPVGARRPFGDFWIPEEAPVSSTEGFLDAPWFEGVSKGYTDYLGSEEFLGTRTSDPTRLKAPPQWLKTFNRRFGGDITTVPTEGDRGRLVREGFYGAFPDYWGTLGDPTTINPAAASILGGTPAVTQRFPTSGGPPDPDFQAADAILGITPDLMREYNEWSATSIYEDPGNELVIRDGQVDLANPFDVDIGTLRASVAEFHRQRMLPGGKGYVAPEVEPFDWSYLTSEFTTREDMTGFNRYLEDWMGGAFAGEGFQWSTKTGEWELLASPEDAIGMEQAITAYRAAIADDVITPTVEDDVITPTVEDDVITPTVEDDVITPEVEEDVITPEVEEDVITPEVEEDVITPEVEEDVITPGVEDAVPDPDEMFADIFGALSGFTGTFDPTTAIEAFNVAVADPAEERFQETNLPAIRASLRGGDVFGTARAQAEERQRGTLTRALTTSRAAHMFTAEEAHKTRALTATGQLQDFYTLQDEAASIRAGTARTEAGTERDVATLPGDVERTRLNNVRIRALTEREIASFPDELAKLRAEIASINASTETEFATRQEKIEYYRAQTARLNAATMRDIAILPEDLKSMQASREYVNAMTANVFHGMEWASALNELRMTYEEVNILTALWVLAQPEQYANQAQINLDMQNWMTAEFPLDFMELASMLTGYQSETQTAYITS